MIGTLFLDRYRIDAQMGQGGMGVVYRAYDQRLARSVAIKVLNKSSIGTEGRARMLKEAQAAAQLNHPNIVSVYDAGESEGVPFIIMELVEGRSLHEAAPDRLEDILAIATQICRALDHAHAHQIVHRDLKPENVLLTSSDQVKLTDFGLARSIASRLTTEGMVAGSVFYLAPELALAQEFDGRADLYALGVMLYELTVGELPFNGSDPLAVISQHLHAPVVSPRARCETIPPGLEALILRLLSKRPEDRPASAKEVETALEAVRAAKDQPIAASPLPLLDRIVRGRLVGREKELSESISAWESAKAGNNSVLLVSGEPGIGKTRLTAELIALAQVNQALVLTGDCYPEGGAPYSPVAQMIEPVAGHPILDRLISLPVLASLAPSLRLRYHDLEIHPDQDPQTEQQRLFESLFELFTALSNQSPLLVVLEDAHWADSSTLFILRHVARRAARLRLRLMILLTYREEELDDSRPLNQVLHDLTRERLAVRIKLGRLDREQTHQLLTAILAEDLPAEFLDAIYRETDGNPFFIEELCKALIEQGLLSRDLGRWQLPDMDEVDIPQSIRVAIQARVARLPAPAQEILRIASILGREFDLETLKGVAEVSEEELFDGLELAQRAQLVTVQRIPGKPRPAASTRFAFAHALIASTLHETLSGLRRQRLHLSAGLSLERLNPHRLDELAPQLGWHFSEAGEWDKAATYFLRAGDQARQVYAYPEAIHQYQHALAILNDQKDFGTACQTWMKVGLLYHADMDFKSSRHAYQEAFTLCKRAGENSPVSLPPAPHPFRVAWKNPLTLDPSLAYEISSIQVIDQLFSGLVSLTVDIDFVPDLAESWEVLEDGKRYIFYLRTNAYWTDGVPVTAHDIEFTWKRLLDPQTHSRNPILFYDIHGAADFHQGRCPDAADVGVHAIDDYTLEVELDQPTGYFLHLLAYAATYPVPRHVVLEKGDAWTKIENIVTNGPFTLGEWIPDDRLVLNRNPRYFGCCSGNLQRVEMSLKPRNERFSTRLADYEAGKYDFIGLGGSAGESDRARQNHAGEYLTLPTPQSAFLVFDTTRPPFDDVRLRRALVHGLDRETLAEVGSRGLAAPAVGGLVPPMIPGHSPDIGLPFSVERARQLFADAGYPSGKGFPQVNVWMITPESMEMPGFIHDQWLEHLGIESHWETMKQEELYKRLLEEPWPHMFFNAWLADYPDPDSFLRVAVAFETRWEHPVYARLVEEARHINRQDQRMQLYREAERILVEEAPLIALFYGSHHVLVKPWVRRHLLSTFRTLILKDIIIDPHDGS